ncbi:MAG: LysM domain-containing protein [Clostridiales bacterium]|nr:LysM domain-containing protein [Clostridiales bacterium]
MIEIVQEEFDRTERKELPKDIRQIGKPDIGDRIYVRNGAYEYLHPYDDSEEKAAYILLGRFEHYAGKHCTFIETAIRLREIAFDGELPIWNDQTWGYIYRQLKQEHDSMAIVGWAVDVKGHLPNLTMRLEKQHQNHFGGSHQVLFLMDSLEREEAFYATRGGHLYRREGFYVYYDNRNVSGTVCMEEIEEEQKEEAAGSFWEEEKTPFVPNPIRGNYRKHILEKEERQRPSYAMSALLVAAVCLFGITAYRNNQKMLAMEATLARMNAGSLGKEHAGEGAAGHMANIDNTDNQGKEGAAGEPAVRVENVAGNVQKQEQALTGAEPSSQAGQETASQQQAASQQQTATQQQAAMQQPGDAAGGAGAAALAEGEMQNAAEPQNAPEGQSAIGAQAAASQQAAATAVPAMTEAQKYLAQGYYIVQQGDSLVGICKKIYQSTAMMDKLCERNGIENQDAIYAGQRLELPKE